MSNRIKIATILGMDEYLGGEKEGFAAYYTVRGHRIIFVFEGGEIEECDYKPKNLKDAEDYIDLAYNRGANWHVEWEER